MRLNPHETLRKTLILRLSSMGDVILASSALGVFEGQQDRRVDWVVAEEFSSILRGHPRLGELWSFSRSAGLGSWVALCRKLWMKNYSEVIDLHGSLRTRMARFLFWFWGIGSGSGAKPKWRAIRRRRLRSYGFYVFKRAWPMSLRPSMKVREFAELAGGTGAERPNLRHLTAAGSLRAEFVSSNDWLGRPYLCVMPGAQWKGKRWPAAEFLALVKRLPVLPVILGTDRDVESLQLVEALRRESIPHVSGVGKWDLRQVAAILGRAKGYVGNDTGLAHLSEAVGTPSLVIFGPTAPELGFGPWRKESAGVGSSLWCRPCGKDGRSCFRVTQRHLCLKSFRADEVKIPEAWKLGGSS